MADPEMIEEIYGKRFPQELFDMPTYFVSAFAHPKWPILKQASGDSFEAAVWGLIPSWTKNSDAGSSIRTKTQNARFETIAEKPSFRSLVNRRRCGVLVDGFVEWRAYGGKKYPYHIALPERRPFLLAGLWDIWKDPHSDTRIETYTVVTVEAKGILAQVHNTKLRMPIILGKASGDAWLNGDLDFRDIQKEIVPLYKPLRAWTVSPLVSQPKPEKNIPKVIEPFDYPELPPLTN